VKQPGIKFYLFLSFLEGGAVMAVELLGAKMIAPFFGSSLYVWAAVLGVTLAGLASGYYAGGLLSKRETTHTNLMIVLLAASVCIIVMPMLAKVVMPALQYADLLYGITVSCMLFLFPPLFFLGTVSPLIIKLLSDKTGESGGSAGKVYAISTVGGIIVTFLTGFFIIPRFGLSVPSLFTGIILGIIPLIILVKGKNILPVFFIAAVIWSLASWKNKKSPAGVKVLYESEGILGQVTVIDYPQDKIRKGAFIRVLMVNKMAQTVYNSWISENPYSPYIQDMTAVAGIKSIGSSVLLLGLGGGALAKNFSELGLAVDAVEIDARIAQAARRFFNLPDNVNVMIDDARRVINRTKKKYDIVAIDIFKGEEPPSYVLTSEALAQVKKILTEDGILMVNFNGYLRGTTGRGTRSVIKTMVASGLDVNILPTSGEEQARNLIIIGTMKKTSFTASLLNRASGAPYDIESDFIALSSLHLEDDEVLTDDKPNLEYLNREAVMSWRKNNILSPARELSGYGVEIFE
jgi:predicted membrane-bound spermidine synthase